MKILVIYTGGTIGMVKDNLSKALKPGGVNGIDTFLKLENLDQYCETLSIKEPIDSSSFDQRYYTELSSLIKDKYYNYDSFLILMGTDTMAYVSSLLSFCISGLSKPILFTGGQKSLYEQKSDSIGNLKEAIVGLKNNSFPNEVGVYFAKQWHRAVAVTKQHSSDSEAYESTMDVHYVPDIGVEFDICTEISNTVAILKLTPFDSELGLLALLKEEKINAIVLEVFGAGNLPNLSDRLTTIMEQRMRQGLKVVVTSQCAYGDLDTGRYHSGSKLSSLGFLEAGGMTKESIVAKILFLLEKNLSTNEFSSMFQKKIRGE